MQKTLGPGALKQAKLLECCPLTAGWRDRNQAVMTATNERRRTYRRTEDIYRKSVETIRDYAIFMTDPDGLVTNWNRGAEQILGYTEAIEDRKSTRLNS